MHDLRSTFYMAICADITTGPPTAAAYCKGWKVESLARETKMRERSTARLPGSAGHKRLRCMCYGVFTKPTMHLHG